MIRIIKTITVILLENNKKLTINEADFNPTIHKSVKGDNSIPTAIDTYLKNKSEGNPSKASTKKIAVVDTKSKASEPPANDVSKTITRKRIALK